MADCEIVKLDNINYVVIDKLISDGVEYLFLINKDDESDFCIKKSINENGTDYIYPLGSAHEFNKIMLMFSEKNK